jgi:hypothetical protein
MAWAVATCARQTEVSAFSGTGVLVMITGVTQLGGNGVSDGVGDGVPSPANGVASAVAVIRSAAMASRLAQISLSKNILTRCKNNITVNLV